jgi:peptidoglycan hydrolase-like protein with peptidoglycan-binding domain
MKIVMSSGHGKYIRGASGYLDEVDEARRVVETTAAFMREMGVSVKTYHDDVSDDQNENLNRIVDFHNSQTRDLDISVHFNANATTSKPMGTECLYVSQEDLAREMSEAVSTALRLPNRGPKYRDNLFFLNNTEKPAILIEVCFVDSSADAAAYDEYFNDCCEAIAEALSGENPPKPPKPDPEPDDDERRMIEEGDEGEDVLGLQRSLGVLEADGNFGSITDTWVRAFQAACGLSADGKVGDHTWAEIDDLDARMREGKPPLPKALADKIYTMAQESEMADYSWPDRGVPPQGYIAGMALSFAYAVTRWRADDEAAGIMAHAEGDPDTDALAWYQEEFSRLGMKNNSSGLDTLRHLFVMQTGLGPRESSGKYCEGRDLSADNVEADTAEAGLFQTSWNINNSSDAIDPMLDDFWDNPNGFLSVFKEGISATKSNLDSYGSGDGARYQFLSRFCPLFHVMVSAVGMRKLRQHWGPINRREVTLKKEMDDLLMSVQELVERYEDSVA